MGMTIGADTQIQLGAEARLTIDRFIADAGGTLTLQSGPMTFQRPKGAAPVPMRIRGAFGLIAVRGTRFFAGPSRGRIGVLVLEGSVSVRSGGVLVRLGPGEGTDIAQRGGRPTAPARWSRERIVEALASVR
jgi:ferric-dicitrate binding protein FerR (iron transport regulator)